MTHSLFLTFADQAVQSWSSGIDWIAALKASDKVSFGGTGASVVAAVTSTVSAVSAHRTVQQARSEHAAGLRPRLLIRPSARSVRVSLASERFEIDDADGLPFGFTIENRGARPWLRQSF